jgi:hypothetical protein
MLKNISRSIYRIVKSPKAIAIATFSFTAIVLTPSILAIAGPALENSQLQSPSDRIERLPTDLKPIPVIRKFPKPIPTPTPTPVAPQVRYRVKMWFVLDNTNDGAFDNTIECYGSLRINGDLYWHIPREQADRNKREAGQQLEISSSPHTLKEFIFDRPTIDYEIFLRDADDRSGDDDVYKSVSQIRTLNLQQDTTSVLQYRNPKTGEASRLFIRVEQM